MNHPAFAQAIEEIITEIKDGRDEKIETAQINFWVPLDSKKKYELIQRTTNRKFGRAIQKLIVQALNQVQIEEIA